MASRVFAFLQRTLLLLFSLSGSHDLCIGVHSMTVCDCGRAQVTRALFQVPVGYYCQFVFPSRGARGAMYVSRYTKKKVLQNSRKCTHTCIRIDVLVRCYLLVVVGSWVLMCHNVFVISTVLMHLKVHTRYS